MYCCLVINLGFALIMTVLISCIDGWFIASSVLLCVLGCLHFVPWTYVVVFTLSIPSLLSILTDMISFIVFLETKLECL